MKTRRQFIKGIVGSFFILPSATTYIRRWVLSDNIWIPNPDYIPAPYSVYWVTFGACEIKIGPPPNNIKPTDIIWKGETNVS